ncbi:hypothetical protein YC2023_061260 [Brassica napus]
MDSLSKQQDAYPLLLCPYNFFRKEEEDYRFVQFGESPTIIPSFSDEWHSGPLKLCINIEGKYVQCEVCRIDLLPATTYYSCNKCRFSRTKAYHKEYIEPIPEHPYHPKHSLRLVSNYRHIYVHKECIYLPCIIRISRHEHRVSFYSSLTPEKWDCGVCRKSIDTNYGRYTCVKGCSYGVHPICATHTTENIKDTEGKNRRNFVGITLF